MWVQLSNRTVMIMKRYIKSQIPKELGSENCADLRRVGIGAIFVARDEELNREVARKEIHPRYADDRPIRTRFRMEAEVTGRLEHPGIVPVYSLGHHPDGRPYYAMRFIRDDIKGNRLKDAIQRFHSSPNPAPTRCPSSCVASWLSAMPLRMRTAGASCIAT